MSKARSRNREKSLRPVERIELSNQNIKRRAIVAALFLVSGIVTIGLWLHNYLKKDAEWVQISASNGSNLDCSTELVFHYHLGQGDLKPSKEDKLVSRLYTEATRDMYCLFTVDEEIEDVKGMYYINEHPNEKIQVDEALYQAFAQIEQYNNREIYLSPIFQEYNDMFEASEDVFAEEFDPRKNEFYQNEFAEICQYANNPEMINVELLGDNTIELVVSEEYEKFHDENQLNSYVDFNWMKNAFIVDYIADVMIDAGYTHGMISSYDGFSRNFNEDTEETATFSVLGAVGSDVYESSFMEYNSQRSIVEYRAFKLTSQDVFHYYVYKDGVTRTSYLSTEDGMDYCATPAMICYSDEKGCAEVLLESAGIYIAPELNKADLNSLMNRKIYSIYAENQVIYYNDANLKLVDIYKDDHIEFRKMTIDEE